MTIDALFGSRTVDVELAASEIAVALRLEFKRHESSFVGGEYYLWEHADDEIAVRPNTADEDGVLIEADYPEHQTLVYVSTDSSWSRWEVALARLEWLDSIYVEEFPDQDGQADRRSGLPVHRRSTDLEYFENEWADRWPENWWGYWGWVSERLGLPVSLEQVNEFRADFASAALRNEVAAYLDAAPYAMVGQTDPLLCRWCDRAFNGTAHQSDGTWVWPDDLGHVVREHGFVVPNRMVDHIRAEGSPPAEVNVPVEKLPWPRPATDT